MEVDIENQTKKMNSQVESLSKKKDDEDENKPVTDPTNNLGRYYGWPASRIVRVSRASGGKDRHSKVLTSKGLRDRRVRLSVNTAIQFYDLQDRLGYDQPSKAVEWLLKAAADSISELPPITTDFPKQQQNSSNSEETSKGSGLSLSRTEKRNKAPRVMEKETTTMNPVSSFTELLNGGIGNGSRNGQWGMEYFASQQMQAPMFSVTNEQQQQQYSFVPEHFVNNGESNNGYNFNFSISSNNNNNNNQSTGSSSGLAGFNRGTLQSNSSPLVPHLQRFNHAIDGSSQSFFTASVENHHHHHHQFVPGFDGRLHLSYGESDSGRHSRGKGKN